MGTIQPSIGRHSLADHRFDFDGFGDIRLDEDGFSTLFGDHMDGLVPTFLVHSRNHQAGTFPGEGQGYGGPLAVGDGERRVRMVDPRDSRVYHAGCVWGRSPDLLRSCPHASEKTVQGIRQVHVATPSGAA